MSTTTDIPQKDNETLEHELEQLQALERKTKDLWSGEVVALVVAFIALVLGAGALAAGLSKTTGGTSTVIIRSGSGAAAGSPARSTMPMHNSRSGMMGTATSGAAGARTVNVTLGEMFVRPDKPTITAGKVTFVAQNTGMLTHE